MRQKIVGARASERAKKEEKNEDEIHNHLNKKKCLKIRAQKCKVYKRMLHRIKYALLKVKLFIILKEYKPGEDLKLTF